jgi:PAS domain S-box-containing protein
MSDGSLTKSQLKAELEAVRQEASKLDASLEAARRLVHSALENSSDGFLMLDRSGRILYLNRRSGQTVPDAKPLDDLLGRSLWELYPSFRGTPAEQELNRALAAQAPATFEQYFEPLGRYFEVRAFPAPEGLAVCFRDVSERKRAEDALRCSEQFFRLVWENSADGMRLSDGEGCIVRVNDAYCRLVERPRADIEGQSLSTVYAPERHQHILATYRARFAAREIHTKFETELTLWNGKRLWLEVTNSYLEIQDRPRLLLGIFRDITERKRAAEDRLDLERKLLEAKKLESLGVLAGGIAHDFNNLLVSVLGNAGLALMELVPESPARTSIERIESAAQRAAELTKQMLAFSGKGRFVMRRVNLSHLIEEMGHLLRLSASRRISLQLQLNEDLPSIEADPAQLRQVVMNLLVNAAEAIGEGQGQITMTTGLLRSDRETLARSCLRTDSELPAGPYVFLEVKDTGCGMAPDTLSRMFEPFFTTKFAGRGMGLPAVLGIIRGHRGAVRVSSQPGKGTTVAVLFPAVESPQQPPVNGTMLENLGGGTVLVIDDEADVRQVTSQMLERMGFHVLSADGGSAGLEVFRTHVHEIACTLLDLTMPAMSGEEVFSALRKIHPEKPVVVMSGYSEIDARSRFAGKGLAGFVEKPFTPLQLQERMRQALGKG